MLHSLSRNLTKTIATGNDCWRIKKFLLVWTLTNSEYIVSCSTYVAASRGTDTIKLHKRRLKQSQRTQACGICPHWCGHFSIRHRGSGSSCMRARDGFAFGNEDTHCVMKQSLSLTRYSVCLTLSTGMSVLFRCCFLLGHGVRHHSKGQIVWGHHEVLFSIFFPRVMTGMARIHSTLCHKVKELTTGL